jgi:hypothetical protein
VAGTLTNLAWGGRERCEEEDDGDDPVITILGAAGVDSKPLDTMDSGTATMPLLLLVRVTGTMELIGTPLAVVAGTNVPPGPGVSSRGPFPAGSSASLVPGLTRRGPLPSTNFCPVDTTMGVVIRGEATDVAEATVTVAGLLPGLGRMERRLGAFCGSWGTTNTNGEDDDDDDDGCEGERMFSTDLDFLLDGSSEVSMRGSPYKNNQNYQRNMKSIQ